MVYNRVGIINGRRCCAYTLALFVAAKLVL